MFLLAITIIEIQLEKQNVLHLALEFPKSAVRQTDHPRDFYIIHSYSHNFFQMFFSLQCPSFAHSGLSHSVVVSEMFSPQPGYHSQTVFDCTSLSIPRFFTIYTMRRKPASLYFALLVLGDWNWSVYFTQIDFAFLKKWIYVCLWLLVPLCHRQTSFNPIPFHLVNHSIVHRNHSIVVRLVGIISDTPSACHSLGNVWFLADPLCLMKDWYHPGDGSLRTIR